MLEVYDGVKTEMNVEKEREEKSPSKTGGPKAPINELEIVRQSLTTGVDVLLCEDEVIREAIKDNGLEINGQTISPHRGSSPCLHLDRLRDCTILSRIPGTSISKVEKEDRRREEGEGRRRQGRESFSTNSASSSSSSSTDSSSSEYRSWYNVYGYARMSGYVPTKWRNAATVDAYFQYGSGPGLYSLSVLTCQNGMTPFSLFRNKTQGGILKQEAEWKEKNDDSFSSSYQFLPSPSIKPDPTPLVIGELETLSVRGWFVNPKASYLAKDGFDEYSTTSTSSPSTSSPSIPSQHPSSSFSPFSSSEEKEKEKKNARSSAEEPIYWVPSSTGPTSHPRYHHGSYSISSASTQAVVHGVMAGVWLVLLGGQWGVAWWKVGRRLSFVHPLLHLPTIHILLRLLIFMAFLYNAYEALVQAELYSLGYVAMMGMASRPPCASSSPLLPPSLFDPSLSWNTSSTSFFTLKPDLQLRREYESAMREAEGKAEQVSSLFPPLSAPILLKASLTCVSPSSVSLEDEKEEEGWVGKGGLWPKTQWVLSPSLSALLWSSTLSLLTISLFYVSHGGSLTRPWGVDRRSKVYMVVFGGLIGFATFASILSSSLSSRAPLPAYAPVPSHYGGSWYESNQNRKEKTEKRESLKMSSSSSSSSSSFLSKVSEISSSMISKAILDHRPLTPIGEVILTSFFDNSIFWRLLCFSLLVLATKSCLASTGIVSNYLNRQLTLLDKELHSSSVANSSSRSPSLPPLSSPPLQSYSRDLWHLSRPSPADIMEVRREEEERTEEEKTQSRTRTSSPSSSSSNDPHSNLLSLLPSSSSSHLASIKKEEEDEKREERRKARAEREERNARKRSPLLILSKLHRSLRRKIQTIKLHNTAVAIGFALSSLLGLVSPFWAYRKARLLSALLPQLLLLVIVCILSYLFLLSKSHLKHVFALNKYLRKKDRKQRRRLQSHQDSSSSSSHSDAYSRHLQSFEGSYSGVEPLLPSSDDDFLLSSRRLSNDFTSDSHGLLSSPNGLSSSSLLHRASMLASEDGFLTEEAKDSLWRSQTGVPSSPPTQRFSTMEEDDDDDGQFPELGPLEGSDDESGREAHFGPPPGSRSSRPSVSFKLPPLGIDNSSKFGVLDQRGRDPETPRLDNLYPNAPRSLIVIYPPSVKISSKGTVLTKDETSIGVECEEKKQARSENKPKPSALPSSALSSSSGVGLDGDDGLEIAMPFAPVPLHPRLAERLKRTSPLPPSLLLSSLSSLSPSPSVSSPPPSSNSAQLSNTAVTIRPPTLGLAKMAHPTSHSEAVLTPNSY